MVIFFSSQGDLGREMLLSKPCCSKKCQGQRHYAFMSLSVPVLRDRSGGAATRRGQNLKELSELTSTKQIQTNLH